MNYSLKQNELLLKFYWRGMFFNFSAPNPCARVKCSHLCFLSQKNGHRCACAEGVKLLDDGLTCDVNGIYIFQLFFSLFFKIMIIICISWLTQREKKD